MVLEMSLFITITTEVTDNGFPAVGHLTLFTHLVKLGSGYWVTDNMGKGKWLQSHFPMPYLAPKQGSRKKY